MQSSTTLSVLVPVYNEEYLVATSLERLMCLAESPLLERIQVVVVDDGSSDRSNEAIARFKNLLAESPVQKINWLFIRHEKNKGKSAAIHTALSAASEELCVIHDADLEYHPGDLVKMVEVFVSERADAVFGSRFLSSEYRRVLFFRHELGNRLLTLLCNLVSDLNLTDMETCYKMVRTSLLKVFPLPVKGLKLNRKLPLSSLSVGREYLKCRSVIPGEPIKKERKSGGETDCER
jgi:glycosyltransferase involved in cell wall biosynthesis